MNLAHVVTPISAEDFAKLLLIMFVGIGLPGLGSWSSRFGGDSLGNTWTDAPSPKVGEPSKDDDEGKPRVWGPGADEIAASFHADRHSARFG
jgi:hypothetical protein